MQDLAGQGIGGDDPQAAIQVRRTAGGEVGPRHRRPEHAAVHGPGRFELSEGSDAPVLGRGSESPSQLAVGGPNAIDASVGRAEQHRAAIVGGRRVDAGAGVKSPEYIAVRGVQGDDLMLVHQRNEDRIADADRRPHTVADFTCQSSSCRRAGVV